MKTIQAIFLVLLVALTCTPFMAQQNTHIKSSEKWATPNQCQPAPNWLPAFQATFCRTASTNWVSELAEDATFYRDVTNNGLVVYLPDYVQSADQLQTLQTYGIYENKNTRLLPIKAPVEDAKGKSITQFMGIIGGVPARMELAVIQRYGSYQTIMGFTAGHQHNVAFSDNFSAWIDQQFPAAGFANR